MEKEGACGSGKRGANGLMDCVYSRVYIRVYIRVFMSDKAVASKGLERRLNGMAVVAALASSRRLPMRRSGRRQQLPSTSFQVSIIAFAS